MGRLQEASGACGICMYVGIHVMSLLYKAHSIKFHINLSIGSSTDMCTWTN
jgi:hypothetical protein